MSAVRRSDVARNLPRDSTYSRFSLSPPSPLHTHACDQMGGGRSAQATHLVEEIGVCSGRLCQGRIAWRGGSGQLGEEANGVTSIWTTLHAPLHLETA